MARKERDKITAAVAALNKDLARLEGTPDYVAADYDRGPHWTKAKSFWALRDNVAYETRLKNHQSNDVSKRYEDAEGADIPRKIIPSLEELEQQLVGGWNLPIDRYTRHLIDALPSNYVGQIQA